MKVRAKVVFSGRVQGVFFRANTQRFAIEQGNVHGWVRNMPDGTVTAVFEGKKTDILKVVSRCVHDQTHARVRSHDIQWEEYKGEFDGFSITYRGF